MIERAPIKTAALSVLLPVALFLCQCSSLWRPALPQEASGNVYGDRSFEVKESKGGGRFSLWIMPPKLLEATVTIEMQLENMRANHPCPFTLDVSQHTMNLSKPKKILQGQAIDANEKYCFYWKYHWKFGIRGGKHDTHVVYSLPFERGRTCKVNQGFFGSYSHSRGSQEEYAVDFGVPQGTLICAAREGLVIAVRSDSNIGGSDKAKYKDAANYVIIKHSDGTYGAYLHLLCNSAMVRPGQAVRRGQAIGKVGATGHVTCPHLHFDVSVPIDGTCRQSCPIRFQTDKGVVSNPMQGETYVAQ